MKKIKKILLSITIILIVNFIVLAQEQTHKDKYIYYTFYLKDGSKIKALPFKTLNYQVTFKNINNEKKFVIKTEEGEKTIKHSEIDHVVGLEYKKEKLILKRYGILYPFKKDRVIPIWSDGLNPVFLKTDKYYLKSINVIDNNPLSTDKNGYKVMDMDGNEIDFISSSDDGAKEFFEKYFGELTNFINCLEKNEFNIKNSYCHGGLVELAAWKYAKKYYKGSPYYEEELSNCQKKIIEAESTSEK